MNLNLIKKDILEIVRSKKLLILICVFLFIALSSPIFAKLMPEIFKNIQLGDGIKIDMPESTVSDSIDQFIKNIGQIGILVVIFVVAGSIVEEKTRRNLEILLTKPISRAGFILSKFSSYFLILSLTFIASAIIFYVYTTSVFNAPDLNNFILLSINILIYTLMIVSITMFGSTIAKNSILAVGIGFIGFILFGTIIGLISFLAPFDPGYIFSHYKELMATGWSNKFLPPMIISGSIIIASLLLSILSFRKQEIER